MFRQTEASRLREDFREKKERVVFLRRLYAKGSGCFGVGKRSSDVLKELKRAEKNLTE